VTVNFGKLYKVNEKNNATRSKGWGNNKLDLTLGDNLPFSYGNLGQIEIVFNGEKECFFSRPGKELIHALL